MLPKGGVFTAADSRVDELQAEVGRLRAEQAEAHAYLDRLNARAEGGSLKKRIEHVHRRAEARLRELVGTLDTVRHDIGEQYPALSEAYVRARAALAIAQPEEESHG